MRFRLATSGADGGGQQLAGGVGNLFRSVAMAPAMAAQAAEEARMNQGKMDLQSAQTALFRNKSAEIDDQRDRSSLGSMLKTAQMVNGVPMSEQADFGNFLQTGQMAGRYEPPVDGVGPRMPVPKFYDDGTAQRILQTLGLTNTALTVGDSNSLNIAKGAGEYQDQRITDQAVALAGRGDDMGMSRLNAIRGKKEFTPFAAVGTTGTALNQITGTQGVANEGLRALFGDESAAAIKLKEAQAGASRASAASSYASAAKTNQERTDGLGRGGQKAPSGYRWAADGGLEVIPGGPADARNKTGAPTEDERKAAGWVTQAQFAFDNMEKVLEKAPGAASPNVIQSMVGAIPGVGQSLSNSMKSEPRQQFEQAAESFAEAALRAATGAGVNRDEAIQKVRELTPQIGDKPGNIQQKREALTVYLDSLKLRAGRALPEGGAAPRPAPAPARGGASGSWDDGAGSGARRISSDAEYNALPSGAVFIGPDNQQRRKP